MDVNQQVIEFLEQYGGVTDVRTARFLRAGSPVLLYRYAKWSWSLSPQLMKRGSMVARTQSWSDVNCLTALLEYQKGFGECSLFEKEKEVRSRSAPCSCPFCR
ncbi:hypothetical protein AB4571_01185 [Vibrio breoganii]|uniref:hypothetical protein n=1 Tax=Vibrio breoganii TaxID=553239 RepID=UPI000C82149B|nr:hypothetical protein [Vibrio breoganii]PML15845.1 hypothetical protein BCT84_07530 [Vibrio breoganii]